MHRDRGFTKNMVSCETLSQNVSKALKFHLFNQQVSQRVLTYPKFSKIVKAVLVAPIFFTSSVGRSAEGVVRAWLSAKAGVILAGR